VTAKPKQAGGGGRSLEVSPRRLPGWVTRFGLRNNGITGIIADDQGVTVTAVEGNTARIDVPFPPMSIGHREPIEAIIDHCAGIGSIGLILVRAGAHSLGICRDGVVNASSTDTHYVQGRTAAGGWSQQRYARRRANQLGAAQGSTADAAARLLTGVSLAALVVGGDIRSITAVLQDRRLAGLIMLPRREFRDISEPRRRVLDEVARRSLDLSITVRGPLAGGR
jgi:hypothetical protein